MFLICEKIVFLIQNYDNMKKRLLVMGLAMVSYASHAQYKSFQEEASFWVRSNSYGSNGTELNGIAPLQKNSKTQLSAPIQEGNSSYYMVFRSLDRESKDLLDFNFACYKHTMTTQNINYFDEVKKQEKIRNGAIVKQGFSYAYQSDKQFLQLIEEEDQTYIYEFIYVNKEFSAQDHQKIQTYLSVKYGISLIDAANYYDEVVGYLWSDISDFNHDITGIGRNDYYQLNTTSTTNSVQNQYTLSASHLDNHEYVFVGSDKGAWKVVSLGMTNVIEKKFKFKATHTTDLDFTFTINTNLLEGAKNNVSYVMYKNDDFTQPIAIGVERNGQVDFRLQASQLDENAAYTIGYATKSTGEFVFQKGDINVYPNPAKIGENITIDFNFQNKTEVEVYVYQVDGKLIQRKKLGAIDRSQFTTQLQQSGTYVFAVVSNGTTQVHKVVIE